MKRQTIIALLAMLLLLSVGCTQAMLAASATDREEHSLPLGPGGTVSLENVNGSLTVRAIDGQQVHILAEKQAKALDEAKAKEALGKLKIVIGSSTDEIKIESVYPSTRGGLLNIGVYLSVNYVLEVPKGTKLKLGAVNGSMTVDAPGSEVSCELTNGSVRVEQARLIAATTVNGKIVFTADNVGEVSSTNGSVEGKILSPKPSAGRIESVNGRVAVALIPEAAVRIEAENVNGSIHSAFSGLESERHNLSGDLNGGGATLAIETVNGGIEIKSTT